LVAEPKPTSKWLKPTKSICEERSFLFKRGEMNKNNSAEWKRNRENSSYQSCYKEKGFSDADWYWTRETYKKYSSCAWIVLFNRGGDLWSLRSVTNYALCVR
jgi:hypothetical protein